MKLARNIAMLCLTGAVMAGVTGSSVAQSSTPDPVDWTQSTDVSIAMSNFAFAPSHIVLQRGKPYRLHFVNDSSDGHTFKAPELFDAAIIAPDARSKIEDGAIDVAKHTTLDVALVPTTAGHYAVECSVFLHAMMGMTADVVVE
jgi:plastocyanin